MMKEADTAVVSSQPRCKGCRNCQEPEEARGDLPNPQLRGTLRHLGWAS